ncbi:MAG: hypothetical protein ACK5BY_02855 [Limnohabitans sp.]|jgi:hypothetical protein|uniref:hypothetical protein n=1 Tax=Limnohabitans sp. TaxID=1907725 RepID=UPI00391950E0
MKIPDVPNQAPEISKNSAYQAASVTFGTAVTLCVVSSLITLVLSIFLPPIAAKHGLSLAGTVTSSNQVVALDFERLLTAGLQSALANPIPASEMEQQASKFQAEIARILKRYNEKGVLVINQKAMIAVPASVDITDKVIRDLGLAP